MSMESDVLEEGQDSSVAALSRKRQSSDSNNWRLEGATLINLNHPHHIGTQAQ
jgi:hypothetical protein